MLCRTRALRHPLQTSFLSARTGRRPQSHAGTAAPFPSRVVGRARGRASPSWPRTPRTGRQAGAGALFLQPGLCGPTPSARTHRGREERSLTAEPTHGALGRGTGAVCGQVTVCGSVPGPAGCSAAPPAPTHGRPAAAPTRDMRTCAHIAERPLCTMPVPAENPTGGTGHLYGNYSVRSLRCPLGLFHPSFLRPFKAIRSCLVKLASLLTPQTGEEAGSRPQPLPPCTRAVCPPAAGAQVCVRGTRVTSDSETRYRGGAGCAENARDHSPSHPDWRS